VVPYVIKGAINDIFETFEECKNAYTGSKGNRWMRVADQEEGKAILYGPGVILPAGSYAFTDGNGEGGVGVLLLDMDESGEPQNEREFRSHVLDVFKRYPLPDPASEAEVNEALSRQGNALAEMAACYLALQEMRDGVAVTVVHDNAAVGDWMEQRSKVRRSGVLRSLVAEGLALLERKNPRPGFRHQYGHRSDWVGRHDYAHYNKRAHELADEGARGQS
jgi:ribonuclease HI